MREISFFRSADAPYYIYGLDFSQKSAGIRALHYLCHALNELGYEAYITCDVTHPALRTPKLTKRILRQHGEAGRTPIVVYPEVVSGNPLAGRIVVRWLLNRPGHLSGDKYFDDNDLIFAHSRAFLPPELQGHVLHLPTVDTSIFNNRDNPFDGQRDLVCYYANKYLAKGGRLTYHAHGAVSLCQDVKLRPADIAQTLRRSRLLYIYEPTALMNEALLCGCPVCVVVTDYWKTNTGNQKFAPDIGVAMEDTPEAFAEAARTVSNYAARYEHNVELAWTQVRRFINVTQARAAELARVAEQPASPEPEGHTADGDTPYAVWRFAHAGHTRGPIPAFGLDALGRAQPAFQIVIPLPEGQEPLLAGTLDSLAKQGYPHWKVSILSQSAAPQDFEDGDTIRWLTLDKAGYVQAFNDVVARGGADWLLALEAGDVLEDRAFSTMAAAIARRPEWQVVYPDEDSQGANGLQQKPFFKPEIAVDLLRSAPYVFGGGALYRYDLLQGLSGFDPAFEGAEFFDLALRAYERVRESGFGHVADVLYHRHVQGGHCRLAQEEVIALRRRALLGHLGRSRCAADAEDGVLPGTFRIRYRFNDSDTVSIVIPTMNGGSFLQRCIGAIVENTDYKNWEVIVVDQGSDDPETLKLLELLPQMGPDTVRILKQPRSASLPAMINAGAGLARGKYLLFMADATAPLRRDWLDEMLGYAAQPDVGVVGAKMIGPDANISFAGYVLGLEGLPAGLHDLHAPPDALGYFGSLQVPGNPSAVSATCMLTEKALFDQLGGFDERALSGGYSDVDYCLKSWQAGRRVVWTPFALLLQEHMFAPPKSEEMSDDEDDEAGQRRTWNLPTPDAQVMFDRWRDRIAFDPAYNRNLSLASGAFEIETSPALTWDPEFRPVPRVLAHTGDRSGSGEYRIIAPLRALVDDDRVMGWDTIDYLSMPELARMSPDVVVFQRQVKPHQVKLIELYARNSNAFRVFELDDLITNIQLGNLARQGYQDKDLVKRFRQALDQCDRFVVSTDYLADEYRKYKADIRVAPNCIERAKWGGLAPKRRQGRRPRVGWAGSVTHVADLAIIADVVKALQDEVEWVFLGLCPEGVRKLVEYHAGVVIEDYPAKLASLNLDLALAPLEDVPFNHAKSHLRLLEYGVLGYPVICTDITPYRGAYPVTRVKNRFKDWVEAIRDHVSDLDELARRGDALRDYINANWMLEDNLDTWLEAWLPT